MICFFIPQLPAFSSPLWGFPVINYGLGGLWPFAVLQLWWPLSCWNICVLVWRFSLVSLVPSSLLTCCLSGTPVWTLDLRIAPPILFSSHFCSFCFLPLGSFHVFFYSSIAVCVGGWGRLFCLSQLLHWESSVLPRSECMLLLRQCCSVVLMIEFFSPLCIYQFSWNSFFVFAIFLQVPNDCIYDSPRSWGLQKIVNMNKGLLGIEPQIVSND